MQQLLSGAIPPRDVARWMKISSRAEQKEILDGLNPLQLSDDLKLLPAM